MRKRKTSSSKQDIRGTADDTADPQPVLQSNCVIPLLKKPHFVLPDPGKTRKSLPLALASKIPRPLRTPRSTDCHWSVVKVRFKEKLGQKPSVLNAPPGAEASNPCLCPCWYHMLFSHVPFLMLKNLRQSPLVSRCRDSGGGRQQGCFFRNFYRESFRLGG